ncbi:hypothetical protein PR048_003540 [Dryococelus australis]|uniref:Uncharacterized protein n=1 Tax=Dryococelus australis TaxID=614101 RepID=A0ABQ9IPQ5_9NEOP|nr:hypothetical protein PR048_003540 [Dryococelus australis]
MFTDWCIKHAAYWFSSENKLGEPGSVPGGVALGFTHVGIVPDDAVGRRVFSGISRYTPPLNSGAVPHSPHFTLIGSQDVAVKSRPHRSAHSFSPEFIYEVKCCDRLLFWLELYVWLVPSVNGIIASLRAPSPTHFLRIREGNANTRQQKISKCEGCVVCGEVLARTTALPVLTAPAGPCNRIANATDSRRRGGNTENVSMEQCRNAMAGETGDLRENPLTGGIVRHDSHVRKEWSMIFFSALRIEIVGKIADSQLFETSPEKRKIADSQLFETSPEKRKIADSQLFETSPEKRQIADSQLFDTSHERHVAVTQRSSYGGWSWKALAGERGVEWACPWRRLQLRDSREGNEKQIAYAPRRQSYEWRPSLRGAAPVNEIQTTRSLGQESLSLSLSHTHFGMRVGATREPGRRADNDKRFWKLYSPYSRRLVREVFERLRSGALAPAVSLIAGPATPGRVSRRRRTTATNKVRRELPGGTNYCLRSAHFLRLSHAAPATLFKAAARLRSTVLKIYSIHGYFRLI